MSIDTAHETWTPADTLANRLLLVRNTTGLSQRAFALKVGVSYGVIQGMENGRSPHRHDAAVQKIVDALGVDRDWLMWGGPLKKENSPGGDTPGQDTPVARRGLNLQQPDYIVEDSNIFQLFPAAA